jgi:hypothetical protein
VTEHSRPLPQRCVVCGIEAEWVWEDGEWVLDWEWWGIEFHCSRHCHRSGREGVQHLKQAAQQPQD